MDQLVVEEASLGSKERHAYSGNGHTASEVGLIF